MSVTIHEHYNVIMDNAADYAAGWNAADAYIAGEDDDVDTRPPREWPARRQRSWARGWTDFETTFYGDDSPEEP